MLRMQCSLCASVDCHINVNTFLVIGPNSEFDVNLIF